MRGHGPVWQALFLAAPAHSYRVLYGSENVPHATYDTAHISRLLERNADPKPLGLTPESANPTFDAKTGRDRLSWLSSKAFFGIVIVILVAVIGLALVHASRRTLS